MDLWLDISDGSGNVYCTLFSCFGSIMNYLDLLQEVWEQKFN